MMTDSLKTKTVNELEIYLQYYNKTIDDDNYQLKTNGAFIFKLENGEVILLPNHLKPESYGIIFQDDACFQNIIKKDLFPLENDNKTIYEEEKKRFQSLKEYIPFYQNYLNERLEVEYKDIDEEKLDTYFRKLMQKKPKKITDLDHVAMGVMFGWLLQKKTNGKWMLEKRYGSYNPYYIPIVSFEGKLIRIFDEYIGLLEGKSKDILKLFNSYRIRFSSNKELEIALSIDYGYEKYISFD